MDPHDYSPANADNSANNTNLQSDNSIIPRKTHDEASDTAIGAAALFCQLSDDAKDAIIKLIKSLLSEC